MNNENWIAEQARLIDLEDGFGPGYAPARSSGQAEVEEDVVIIRPTAA